MERRLRRVGLVARCRTPTPPRPWEASPPTGACLDASVRMLAMLRMLRILLATCIECLAHAPIRISLSVRIFLPFALICAPLCCNGASDHLVEQHGSPVYPIGDSTAGVPRSAVSSSPPPFSPPLAPVCAALILSLFSSSCPRLPLAVSSRLQVAAGCKRAVG